MSKKPAKNSAAKSSGTTETNGAVHSLAPQPNSSEENLRLLAYFKWEAAGKPEGDGTPFWLEAEHELSQT
jgi:hypothetical protein